MKKNFVLIFAAAVIMLAPVVSFASSYAKVIVVAQSGGDFTDLPSALISITDASPTNHYLVKVMPGVYNIENGGMGGGHVFKSYVDVEGSGEKNTIFTSTNPAFGIFYIDNIRSVELRDLTIKYDLPGAAYRAGIYIDNAQDVILSNVTFALSHSTPPPAIATSILSNLPSNYTLKNVTINSLNAINTDSWSTSALILNSTINGSIYSRGSLTIVDSLLKVIPSNSKTVHCYDANYDAISNGWH